MNKSAIYYALEKEFLATVIDELMPGVLHNFANPLNGIMGRSKLLQRRLEDTIEKIEKYYPVMVPGIGQDKITRDINTIVLETDRFYKIFQGLAQKFSTLSSHEMEKINLSHLIDMEFRFTDFYLDFKHDCKKHLQMDPHLPELTANPADYSLCFSALLRSSKDRMKDCPVKEISLTTTHDETCIIVTLVDTGNAISDLCIQLTGGSVDSVDMSSTLPDCERGLCYSLLYMREQGVQIQIRSEQGNNMVSLSIPYR